MALYLLTWDRFLKGYFLFRSHSEILYRGTTLYSDHFETFINLSLLLVQKISSFHVEFSYSLLSVKTSFSLEVSQNDQNIQVGTGRECPKCCQTGVLKTRGRK